jgi:hypothetical protein
MIDCGRHSQRFGWQKLHGLRLVRPCRRVGSNWRVTFFYRTKQNARMGREHQLIRVSFEARVPIGIVDKDNRVRYQASIVDLDFNTSTTQWVPFNRT